MFEFRNVSCFIGFCLCIVYASSEETNLSQSTYKVFRKVYTDCESSDDLFKCLKVQAIKLTDRALKINNIKIIDGLSVIKKSDNIDIRSFTNTNTIPDNELMSLSTEKVDKILSENANKFLETHEIEMSVPRVLSKAHKVIGDFVEEGRKKKEKFQGPFMAAMAIKAGILTMAYQSIAIVAGKALIIGKIALIISAIIGLKKLVTPEGHEKTTYEIVKHPHVQQSHTYSSSHNDFEGHEDHHSGGGGGGSGQYQRSLQDINRNNEIQDRVYNAHVPLV